MTVVLALLFTFTVLCAEDERGVADRGAAVAAVAADRTATDRAAVVTAWQQMPESERAAVIQSFERWQQLAPDDREVMKRRHQRLKHARSRVRDVMANDSQREVDAMEEGPRRHELNRCALLALRERFDELPPEIRERIDDDLRPFPPHQRERSRKQLMKQYVDFALVDQLKRMVDHGVLDQEEVADLGRRIAETPGERLGMLRQFIADHPVAFRLPPEIAEKVRSVADPRLGLHLLDKLRRRGRGDKLPPPPFPLPPRPPRDGGPPGGPPPGGPPFGGPPSDGPAREVFPRNRDLRDPKDARDRVPDLHLPGDRDQEQRGSG